MKKWVFWLVITTLVISSLGCIIPIGLPRLFSGNSRQEETLPLPQPTVTPTMEPQPSNLDDMDLTSRDTLLTDLYAEVSRGVVSILATSDLGISQGSGFVYDLQGHVITNYHVVEGANKLEVDFPSGFKVRGDVIATDLDSDLAVIKVNAPESELFPLGLGDSDAVEVGQTAIAIGNPFGLTGTMTVGIVSAKGRTIDSMRASASGRAFSAGGVIQTDASINPGNSGGPLIDINGNVIGLNRAIQTDSTTTTGDPTNSGIGFAVPVNIIKRVVPILISEGVYDYPYLGITSKEDITLEEKEILGLDRTVGAYVLEVVDGGPADKAGVRGGTKETEISGLYAGGDVLIAVDERPIRVFGDLLTYLMMNKSPGEQIVLTVVRNGKTIDLPLTLGKRP